MKDKNADYRDKALDNMKILNFHAEEYGANEEAKAKAKEINIRCINDIMGWVNSLPANLRYGNPRTNRALHDNFDPMGDEKGQLTTYEEELIKNEKFKELVAVEYFFDVDSKNFQTAFSMSSTGKTEKFDPVNQKLHYYIRTKGKFKNKLEFCYFME